MRIRKLSDSRDAARIRTYLAKLVQEARQCGNEDITLEAGRICQELGLNTEDAFAACCRVLDSEKFTRTHGLLYHHRTGVWGTEEARYAFLLDMSGYHGAGRGSRSRERSRLQLVLLALVAGATVGVAGVVATLLIS